MTGEILLSWQFQTVFHDALSIAPYTYTKRTPIFLSEPNNAGLSCESFKAIQTDGLKRVIIVGGPVAVPVGGGGNQLGSLYIGRLCGVVAFETSNAIAEWCIGEDMQAINLCIAAGNSYYDALTGASLCGERNSVLY